MFWWKSKKQTKKKIRELEENKMWSELIHRQKAIYDKFPEGSRFGYLGCLMIVTGYQYACSGFSGGMRFIPARPFECRCDYVDNNGVIRNVTFGLDEMLRIVDGKDKYKR